MACPPRVKGALAELPGVAEVAVDYDTKLATCKVDTAKFDKDAAVDALTAADFKDSVVQ